MNPAEEIPADRRAIRRAMGLAQRLPWLVSLQRTLLLALALLLVALSPAGPALAVAVADLPASAPAEQVLDTADVFSRASRSELEAQLQALAQDRVDARLITVNRLDYGLDLQQLGEELLQRWSAAETNGAAADQARLLLLIESQNKGTAIVASPGLERQLPGSLLRSTARTTMAQPLRQGDRYRQASLDALTRLRTVLEGGEDPGEPVVVEAAVAVSNVPTAEETRSSNALTWVVVLLVVGSVVPMLTWWVFSR